MCDLLNIWTKEITDCFSQYNERKYLIIQNHNGDSWRTTSATVNCTSTYLNKMVESHVIKWKNNILGIYKDSKNIHGMKINFVFFFFVIFFFTFYCFPLFFLILFFWRFIFIHVLLVANSRGYGGVCWKELDIGSDRRMPFWSLMPSAKSSRGSIMLIFFIKFRNAKISLIELLFRAYFLHIIRICRMKLQMKPQTQAQERTSLVHSFLII